MQIASPGFHRSALVVKAFEPHRLALAQPNVHEKLAHVDGVVRTAPPLGHDREHAIASVANLDRFELEFVPEVAEAAEIVIELGPPALRAGTRNLRRLAPLE